MSFRTLVAALVAATVIAAAPAVAHELKTGTVTLTDLWTRATPPGAPTAAGYLTMTNTGNESETLLAVSSSVASAGELHIMETKDGVMTMHPVEGGITVPPGAVLTLAPGGYHLMFIKLTEPLKEGSKMPVTLTFARAGKVDTFLHVLAIGSKGPDGTAPAQHENH